MKKFFAILTVLILVFGAIMGFRTSYRANKSKMAAQKTAQNSPTTSQVSISNFAYSPQVLTVSVGATVTFANNDSTVHTVTMDKGSFNSGNIGSGKSAKLTFQKAGTYNYHCALHSQMKGSVIVK